MRRRAWRCGSLIGVPVIAAALLTVPAAGLAAPSTDEPEVAAAAAVLCENEPGAWPLLDGNCTADTVAGAPGYDVGGRADAGAIQVTYNIGSSGTRSSQLLTAGSLGFADQAGASFGAAVSPVWLNDDEYLDVAVGAPGATVGGVAKAGAVFLIYGAEGGLGTGQPGQMVTEQTLGLPTSIAGFGTALTDVLLGDGYGLAIGAPLATVAGKAMAGRVDVVRVASNPATLVDVVTQGGAAVEAGDRFGQVLAATDDSSEIAIGIPYEDVGSRADAGAVAFWQDGVLTTFTQDSSGMGGTAEAGDRFGASIAAGYWYDWEREAGRLDAVFVGVPLEDGRGTNSGAVNVLMRAPRSEEDPEDPSPWTSSRYVVTASSVGFVGSEEADDRLGASLEFLCWQEEDSADYYCLLAIGVPYEDVGSVRNAGSVCLVDVGYVEAPNVAPAFCVDQRLPAMPGSAETGDHFGQAMSTVLVQSEDTLIISATGEDAGTKRDVGAVHTAYPHGRLPIAVEQAGARYGSAFL